MVSFIYGRSGSGKSDCLFSAAERTVSCGRHVYFLVPDREAVNAERSAAKRNLGADVDIITFTRLCDFVFRRYGGICKTYIDSGAKKIIMRRALTSLSPALSVYGGISDSDTNAVAELVKLRTDMARGKVTPKALMEASEKISENGRLSEKLSDIALIAAEYDALVSEKYDDPDSALSEAADKLRSSDFFSGCDVFIDSFAFFTKEQYEVISQIFRQAENVYISLAYDPTDDQSLAPFYNISETGRRLRASAYENGCETAPDTVLREAKRFDAPELSYLALNLWHEPGIKPVYRDKCSALRVICAANKTEEARAVACDIARRVRLGARYHDFAVISRRREDYAGIVDAMFRSYSIPYFLSARSDIMLLAPVRFIFAALEICRRGFTLENVITYIKTGLLDIPDEALGLFETYITRWNIHGKGFTDGMAWTMNPDGYGASSSEETEQKLAQINTVKEAVISPLHRFCREAGKKQNVREHCRVLFEFISYMRIPEHTKKLCASLSEAGEAGIAAELSQAHSLICDMLDSLVACSGDTEVTCEGFSFMLKMIAQDKDVGNIPTSVDEVLITEAGASNSENVKYVYVIGAAAGSFPATVTEESFFSEHEKQLLSDVGIEISTRLENKLADELFFFYSAVCSASSVLTVTYPRYISGEKAEKCAPLRRILEMFPALSEERFEETPVVDLIERPLSAMEYAASLSGALGDKLREYFLSNEKYAQRLKYINEPLSAKECRLSPECTEELFPQSVNISYSRLEKYIRCNFSYFCDYELKIADCSKIKFGALDIGSFMHKLLEEAARYVLESGEHNSEKTDLYIRACAQDYLKKTAGGEEFISGRLRHISDKLCKCAGVFISDMVHEFDQSGFRAVDFEASIGTGEGNIPPMKLEDERGKVQLRGIIDRVDMLEGDDGNLYVRIADYKTGTKTFDMNKIREGFDLQMLLYLFSVCENGEKKYGKKPIPAGVLYIGVKPPRKSGHVGEDTSADFAPVKSGILINDENILRRMEKKLEGHFIPITEKNLTSGKGLLSPEEFESLKGDVRNTVLAFAAQLRSGEAGAKPVSDKDIDPCKYCKNKAICRAGAKSKARRK